jgi:excisionase family DNA binding protein
MSQCRGSEEQLTFFSRYDVLSLGDGSFKIIPQKPVQHGSVKDASKTFKVSRATIYRLIDAGFIRFRKASPRKIQIDFKSLEEHLHATEDPEFWTEKRRSDFFSVI